MNFIKMKSLITSREELKRMIVGEEFVSSCYAMTTTGIDVDNVFFDEDGFWAPTQKTIKVIFLQFNI